MTTRRIEQTDNTNPQQTSFNNSLPVKAKAQKNKVIPPCINEPKQSFLPETGNTKFNLLKNIKEELDEKSWQSHSFDFFRLHKKKTDGITQLKETLKQLPASFSSLSQKDERTIEELYMKVKNILIEKQAVFSLRYLLRHQQTQDFYDRYLDEMDHLEDKAAEEKQFK